MKMHTVLIKNFQFFVIWWIFITWVEKTNKNVTILRTIIFYQHILFLSNNCNSFLYVSYTPSLSVYNCSRNYKQKSYCYNISECTLKYLVFRKYPIRATLYKFKKDQRDAEWYQEAQVLGDEPVEQVESFAV